MSKFSFTFVNKGVYKKKLIRSQCWGILCFGGRPEGNSKVCAMLNLDVVWCLNRLTPRDTYLRQNVFTVIKEFFQPFERLY